MNIHAMIFPRFTRLVVFSRADEKITASGKKRTMWQCRCDCGNIVIVRDDQLKSGHTRSCGCLHRDYSRSGDAGLKHGYAKGIKISEYTIWCGIKARCFNKNNPAYKNYGGRGITVCDRWKDSFQNFIDDMGFRPSKKHTIERLDNDGPYAPHNCTWKERVHQNKNKRNCIAVTANGKTMILAEWARELGVNSQTLERRYHAGWSHEDIVNKPVKRRR